MIRVYVERTEEGQIRRILVTGHAEFDECGKDIVCAAVSAIVIGLANAIEEMFGLQIHAADDGDGKVDCQVPVDIEESKREKICLIMEAMHISLQGMAREFPKYIRMEKR